MQWIQEVKTEHLKSIPILTHLKKSPLIAPRYDDVFTGRTGRARAGSVFHLEYVINKYVRKKNPKQMPGITILQLQLTACVFRVSRSGQEHFSGWHFTLHCVLPRFISAMCFFSCAPCHVCLQVKATSARWPSTTRTAKSSSSTTGNRWVSAFLHPTRPSGLQPRQSVFALTWTFNAQLKLWIKRKMAVCIVNKAFHSVDGGHKKGSAMKPAWLLICCALLWQPVATSCVCGFG